MEYCSMDYWNTVRPVKSQSGGGSACVLCADEAVIYPVLRSNYQTIPVGKKNKAKLGERPR